MIAASLDLPDNEGGVGLGWSALPSLAHVSGKAARGHWSATLTPGYDRRRGMLYWVVTFL
ncbi:MAG: hypothetical protein HGA19_10910 [Oscillochloris sp.]|nr:hypothetical protein [Oscillochloris sp.]